LTELPKVDMDIQNRLWLPNNKDRRVFDAGVLIIDKRQKIG